MESVLNEPSFAPIEFCQRSFRHTGCIYHVYSSASEYKEVEAASAYEAMTSSGINKPLKIARFMASRLAVLDSTMLEAQMANSASVSETPTEPQNN